MQVSADERADMWGGWQKGDASRWLLSWLPCAAALWPMQASKVRSPHTLWSAIFYFLLSRWVCTCWVDQIGYIHHSTFAYMGNYARYTVIAISFLLANQYPSPTHRAQLYRANPRALPPRRILAPGFYLLYPFFRSNLEIVGRSRGDAGFARLAAPSSTWSRAALPSLHEPGFTTAEGPPGAVSLPILSPFQLAVATSCDRGLQALVEGRHQWLLSGSVSLFVLSGSHLYLWEFAVCCIYRTFIPLLQWCKAPAYSRNNLNHYNIPFSTYT
jgi:hypothetical protein